MNSPDRRSCEHVQLGCDTEGQCLGKVGSLKDVRMSGELGQPLIDQICAAGGSTAVSRDPAHSVETCSDRGVAL